MKRNWFIWLGILICLAAIAGSYLGATGMMNSIYAYRSPLEGSPPQPGNPVGTPLTNRLVFVLIDSLRLDTADNPQMMPFLNELRQQGASAEMQSGLPSYSETTYSVLFTGAWPELNDGPAFNLPTAEIPVWTQDNLFSAANRNGLKIAVSGYEWFGKLIPPEAVNIYFYTPDEDRIADREVMDAALPWLQSGEYALILIHLDQVDFAGHYEGGPQSPNWTAAATRVDNLLREIVATMDLSKDTLFICSDHGQVNQGGHGGGEQVVLREPFLILGAGIIPGEYAPVEMVDVAPTLAILLGLNLPASSQGQVRSEMLSLSGEEITAIETATIEQQNRLAAAYGEQIGQQVDLNGDGNIGEATQQAMRDARQVRVNAERLPRFLLAGILALIPLFLIILKRSRNMVWLITGALLFQIVFNLRYGLIDGKGYSFSYVIGSTELVVYGVITALIAFGIGWLVVLIGTRNINQGPRKAVIFSLSLALVTLYIISLPVLWSYAMDGLYASWVLPDLGRSFMALFAMVQALAVGLWGLIFTGIAALLAIGKWKRS
jgi:hypothetical protein